MENLAVAVARVGGDPLIRLEPSPATQRRLLRETPARFDGRPSAGLLKLAEVVTVAFTIESADWGATKDQPPERIQARNGAALAVQRKLLDRKVRQVFLGNGLYPTGSRAKELGLSLAELSRIYRAGLDVDYPALQKTAAVVGKRLEGKRAVLRCPRGTALEVDLRPKTVLTNDGILSEAKVRAGGAAATVWLPAGEAYALTVAGTGTGKVVVPSVVFESQRIEDLVLTFEKGVLRDMKAKPGKGFDALQAHYKVSAAGRERLSVLDIGLNEGVTFPAKAHDLAFPAAGIVTVFVGGDVWAGGDNKSTFGLSAFVRGATLEVDGTPVVRKGQLVR